MVGANRKMTDKTKRRILLCMAIAGLIMFITAHRMVRSNERHARFLAEQTLYEPKDKSLYELQRTIDSYQSYPDAERKYLDAGKRNRRIWTALQFVGYGLSLMGAMLFQSNLQKERKARLQKWIRGDTKPQPAGGAYVSPAAGDSSAHP